MWSGLAALHTCLGEAGGYGESRGSGKLSSASRARPDRGRNLHRLPGKARAVQGYTVLGEAQWNTLHLGFAVSSNSVLSLATGSLFALAPKSLSHGVTQGTAPLWELPYCQV